MSVRRQRRRPVRLSRHGAGERLAAALETFTHQDTRAATPVTVAELCRVADVSRNSLYRYHLPILKALHKHQRLGRQAANKRVRKSAERRRVENIALRENLAKLAALVDHYYAAYRETAGLLERRDRELAELRSRLAVTPALLTAPGGLAARGAIALHSKKGPSA